MMTSPLLSLLLAFQLMCSPAPAMQTNPAVPESARLWWGLIDPELSLWFSRLPLEDSEEGPILWDFSWRGFLASLFAMPRLMEEVSHAAHA